MSTSADRLSLREKIAYGLGDTASNFYFALFNGFLVYYYTDVYGMDSSLAGTLSAVIPSVVALLNPVVGMVADRTQTRWGKFRPYLLWGAVPYGVFGFLMFANPAIGPSAKVAFAAVTYALTLAAYAFINTPYSALMGVMSPSSEERTALSTYRFACAFTGGLLIGWLVPWLKNHFGATEAISFRNTMALFAVTSVGLFLYTFFQTKERVQSPPPPAGDSIGADLADLRRNVPWMILFFAGFLTLANVGLRSGAGIFYFKYVVGDETWFGRYNLLGSLAFISGSLLTKGFLKFFGRRTLMIWLTCLNGLAMAAFYVVDPKQQWSLIALNVFAGFVAGPTPAIVWSFYADTADYGEWKFGRRSTGLLFSAAVLAQKVGLALGSAMLGWLLAWFGYKANAVQTPTALFGIKVVFAALPGLFAVLSGLAILFYRLDEPTVKQIEQDLAARRKAAAPVPAAS